MWFCLSLTKLPCSQFGIGNFSTLCRGLTKSMAQTNALLILVTGLSMYHQRQSLNGSSLNPDLSTFQSKCLDYYKIFVCLSKNILKAQSPKSKNLLQWEVVYVFIHISPVHCSWKKCGVQKKHQKVFQSIKSFQPWGTCHRKAAEFLWHTFSVKLDFFFH